MAVLAHDDVVMNRDAERAGNADDGFRHLDVGSGGSRIAGGMVMK
jgi:hypothetical protein